MMTKEDFDRINEISNRYDYLLNDHLDRSIEALSKCFSEEEIDIIVLFRNIKGR